MAAPQENNKAAQMLAYARLGHLNVVILEADIQTAQLVRQSLGTLGVTHTSITRNANEAITMISERQADVLIMEWDCKPIKGLEVTRILRAPDSPNRLLPILLTTSRNSQAELLQARGAGVTEIIMKPFNLRVLQENLNLVIDDPRAFIISENYIGPDRRRGNSGPPEGAERRASEAESPPVAITREEMSFQDWSDGRPRLVLADFIVKKRIEAAAASLKGMEALLPESEVAKRSEDFVQWMMTDIVSIKQACKSIGASPDNARTYIDRLTSATQSLRSHALTAGFPLCARTAASLHDFARRRYDAKNPDHLVVLTKHTETLQALIAGNIKGDDHLLARAIIGGLEKMIKKYS